MGRAELLDPEVEPPLFPHHRSGTGSAWACQGDHALFGQRPLAANDAMSAVVAGPGGGELVELDPAGIVGPVRHVAAKDEAGSPLTAHANEIARRQSVPARDPHVLGVELGTQLFEIGRTWSSSGAHSGSSDRFWTLCCVGAREAVIPATGAAAA